MSKASKVTKRAAKHAADLEALKKAYPSPTVQSQAELVKSQLALWNEPEQPEYVTTHLSILNARLESLLEDPTKPLYIPVYEVLQRASESKYSNWRKMYRTMQPQNAHSVAEWYKVKYPHLDVKVDTRHLRITGTLR